MLTVNPCPVCGKSMGYDPNFICNHKFPESVTTTNNDEYVIFDSSEFVPLDEKMQIDLR